MSEQRPMAAKRRVDENVSREPDSAERQLRALRYVVAAIDDEAQKTWAALWRELQGLESTGDATDPPAAGYQPPGGWPCFVERLWALKHYLDHIQKLCR